MPTPSIVPARSFVPVAPDSDFPLQNLPYGVFRSSGSAAARVGVAIGDQVLDLAVLEGAGLFDGPLLAGRRVFGADALNAFMALGPAAWREARSRLTELLAVDGPGTLRDDPDLRASAFHRQSAVEMLLPVVIGDYTDFYASREHATNVGTMFRGADKALMPNWLHLPVGYHGRASTVVVSGTDVHRPSGQTLPPGAESPVFGPSLELDFELEIGALVGVGNAMGRPIPVGAALDHVFGLVLLNDWSARDIQRWEYVPLGPFLAKNFATSISPWVVPLAALEPFRVPGPEQDPLPLPYLRGRGAASYDIQLEVDLQSAAMAAARPAFAAQVLCRTNFRRLYWSIAQQVAHHTVGGCALRTGDLLGSGTISGPGPGERGSLLEITWQGKEPLSLPSGETRRFLEDGDSLTLRGYCQGDGFRIGFGECRGRVLPSPTNELP